MIAEMSPAAMPSAAVESLERDGPVAASHVRLRCRPRVAAAPARRSGGRVRAHPFVGGDFVIGEALAQAREDTPPPEHHAMRAQPPAPRRAPCPQPCNFSFCGD